MVNMGKIAIAAVLACGLATANAEAGFVLEVSDGSSTVTISDNGIGDAAGNAGTILWAGGVGNFFLNVITGDSKPILVNSMNLNYSVRSTGLGGTLTLKLTDTSFSAGSGAHSFIAADIGGGVLGSTTRYRTYSDAGNAEFGLTNLLFDSGTLAPPPAAQAAAGNGSVIGNPFSLTQVIEITHAGAQGNTAVTISSGDARVSVPEPGSMLLLGAGLLGFAASIRRRAAK
jgi:hypothetical protein